MPDFKTPGVYIEEKNAFPSSAVAVPTAVPVFIGYTEKAERKAKSLFYVPTKISSLAEYVELFGAAFKARFVISDAPSSAMDEPGEQFNLNGKDIFIKLKANNELYFYNSIKFFYLNGGSQCYILSVGKYADAEVNGISANDYFGKEDAKDAFKILEKEWEPTLVLIPDGPALPAAAYYTLCREVLKHCGKTQNRFAILDVLRSTDGTNDSAINNFRDNIGNDFLNYGAAYYPWLKTSVVDESEVDFNNLDEHVATLKKYIPVTEEDAVNILNSIQMTSQASGDEITLQIHKSLLTSSNTYKQIITEIRSRLNLLPPGAGMAGIYNLVDTSRGVWKSPANVSVSSVNVPAVNILSHELERMNVDPVSGKSINIIRAFPDIGTLVWGARTLDGNSQDWRYINVRRTMIMIEQSLKLATRAYVFEPNDSGTWVSLKSMINNFLFNLWKQGALPGTTPETAYSIQIGLGVTMTADDILNGILRLTVLIAIVRPAEFIEITFQQQQQQA